MRKRGITPDVDLMRLIPYLNKERASGLSYLRTVAMVMSYPVMGHDLTDIAKEIWAECPDPVRTVMYGAIVYQTLSGWEKMEQSMDYLDDKFKLAHKDKMALEDLGDLNALSNEDIWAPEGSLHQIALVQGNQPHSWKESVAHPASLASAYLISRSYLKTLSGIPAPNLDDEALVLDHVLRRWLTDIGKVVGSVLPRTADQLLPTSGNLGANFQRHQIGIYSKVLKAWRSNNRVVKFSK
jgi:hypothetical protein